jgi:hypothetical protein
MLATVMVVLALAALAAWLVAVVSALAIVGLAPSGQKLKAYFALGWWRFARVAEIAGPAALPHIARYRTAFLAFFACIILAIAMVFLLTFERQN